MLYRILADGVVVVHFTFIIFVATGSLLAWRWPALVWAHLPAVAWGIGTVTIGFPCPLTPLEKGLRRRAGDERYEGGFVDRYIEDVIYPDEYSSVLRALAAVTILAGYLVLRWRRAGSVATSAPSRDAAQEHGGRQRLRLEGGTRARRRSVAGPHRPRSLAQAKRVFGLGRRTPSTVRSTRSS